MIDLAYIDERANSAVSKELESPTIGEKSRAEIKAKSLKHIAGFEIQDEEAEKKLLDEMIASQRKLLETFVSDRKKVRDSLQTLGVTPLAVLPTVAWTEICQQTKLFRFQPDKNGMVGVNRHNLNTGLPAARPATLVDKVLERKPRNGTPEELAEAFAKDDWEGFLLLCFPNYSDSQSNDLTTKLVLPTPPADVAAILLKAQSRALKVAAVPEAVRLGDSPGALAAKARYTARDNWARAQGYEDYADWVKRDPIVYTEQGTATAIIAQFGEFPIEKMVVDMVVDSDKLIPDVVHDLSPSVFIDQQEHYRRMIEMQRYQHQAILGLAGSGGGGGYSIPNGGIMGIGTTTGTADASGQFLVTNTTNRLFGA